MDKVCNATYDCKSKIYLKLQSVSMHDNILSISFLVNGRNQIIYFLFKAHNKSLHFFKTSVAEANRPNTE